MFPALPGQLHLFGCICCGLGLARWGIGPGNPPVPVAGIAGWWGTECFVLSPGCPV